MFSMSVLRFDSGRLSKAGTSPTGGARLSARLARTGIQVYKLADGTVRREYRPASEVFAADSLASYVASVLTIGHPLQGVTPKNFQAEAVGSVVAPTRVQAADGFEYVEALVDVNRADAIEQVDSGEGAELSAGYRCDFDPTPGVVPEGEPQAGEKFDGVQRNIRINHNAILPEGRARAGRGAKFLTDEIDSDGNQIVRDAAPKEHRMKFTVDGIEYEAGPALTDAIKRLEAKNSANEVKASEAVTAAGKSDAKADAAERAKAEAQALVTPAAIAARVDEEIAFRALVSPVLDEKDKPFDFAGKSRRDVKTAVVKKLSAKDLKADAEDGYVDAYFDSAIEQFKKDEAERVKRGSENYVPPKGEQNQDANPEWYLDSAAWDAKLHSLHGKDLPASLV